MSSLMSTFALVVVGVVVVLIGILAGVIIFGGSDSASTKATQQLESAGPKIPLDLAKGSGEPRPLGR